MQFKVKLMSDTLENDKKPNFGLKTQLFGLNLGPQFLFMTFTSTSSKTMFQPIILWNLNKN